MRQDGMKSYLITEEARRRKRERIIMATAVVLITVFSLIQYYLLSNTAPLPLGSNVLIFFVININILLILVLIFFIVRNIVKLIFEDRRHVLGARLRTKMVIAFVFLSLVPTAVLFVVAFQFLNTSISYWFDVKVENSLESAITIGRAYYEQETGELKKAASDVAGIVTGRCLKRDGGADLACIADVLSHVAGKRQDPLFNYIPVQFVQYVGHDGTEFVAACREPFTTPPPVISTDLMQRAVRAGGELMVNEKAAAGEILRCVIPLRAADGKVYALLVAGRLLPGDMLEMLDRVRQGYEDYSQLQFFQNPIKTTLLVTLFLITVLIIFVAIWFGFRLAKGITEPVQMLAEGVRRVAHGDLDFRLEVRGRDELSSLVRAFNTMTSDLKEARRKAERASRDLMKSYRELENRRRYVEILLQNVNAGVIAIDRSGNVTTMNFAAEKILGRQAESIVGKHYSKLLSPGQVEAFEGIRSELAASPHGTVRRPVRMQAGDHHLSLVVNFTMLHDTEGEELGIIVVFDDLTELEKIQRLAAWREVARRIAHEVKNPLTPIQLSAQRLRKRFMEGMEEEGRAVFDKCTRTIITQVEEIRRLVNEFSRFARMPEPSFRIADISSIINDLVELYRQNNPGISFEVHGASVPVAAEVDSDQFRRVLVNLFDNAVAAMDHGGSLTITVKCTGRDDRVGEELVVTVADTGRGISKNDMDRLFDPYFSRSRGGTGLGLAIVNSIISDHHGSIKVSGNYPSGAVFTIKLPCRQP